MKTLTIDDILYINKQTIDKHGVTHGVKNLSFLPLLSLAFIYQSLVVGSYPSGNFWSPE